MESTKKAEPPEPTTPEQLKELDRLHYEGPVPGLARDTVLLMDCIHAHRREYERMGGDPRFLRFQLFIVCTEQTPQTCRTGRLVQKVNLNTPLPEKKLEYEPSDEIDQEAKVDVATPVPKRPAKKVGTFTVSSEGIPEQKDDKKGKKNNEKKS